MMVRGIASLLSLFFFFRGMSLVSGASEGFSMNVSPQETGMKGGSVVLPCVFSRRDPSYEGPIVVIWRTDQPFHGPVIFQCSVTNSTSGDLRSDNCTESDRETHRYRLVGDPRKYNLSLQIQNLTYEDSRFYYCRVELSNIDGESWTNTTGTNLTVVAKPKIMNLTLHGNESVGRWLECVVEGLPLPNITWILPNNSKMPVLLETKLAEQNQAWGNLSVSQNGTYSCLAENKYGNDTMGLRVGEIPTSATSQNLTLVIAVLLVLLILLCLGIVVVFLMYRKRKGSSFCWKTTIRECTNPASTNHYGPMEESSTGKTEESSTYANIQTTTEQKKGKSEESFTDADIQVTSEQGKEGMNEEGCTYADIQFITKQEKGKEKRTNPVMEREDVTYAAVVTKPNTEKLPEAH